MQVFRPHRKQDTGRKEGDSSTGNTGIQEIQMARRKKPRHDTDKQDTVRQCRGYRKIGR
jgi:hypothetical protein